MSLNIIPRLKSGNKPNMVTVRAHLEVQKMQISAVLLNLHLNLDYMPPKASLNMLGFFLRGKKIRLYDLMV